MSLAAGFAPEESPSVMPSEQDQVERIVHEVLARLSGDTGKQDTSGQSKQPLARASSASEGELVLNDKVISAATLTDRLNGIQRVIVAPRAVVTPSARDLLKDKNVTVVRALQGVA